MTSSHFYIKSINNDNYIIYNSKRHIPIKVDSLGKQFFDLITNVSDKQERLGRIETEQHKEFLEFQDSLESINFFSSTDEFIDKSFLQTPFNQTKSTFYIHLTDRCNLKCSYCYNSDQRSNPKDMSLDDWKTVIDKIGPYAHSITITGGEALLHKSFKQILTYIKDKYSEVIVSLFSNGILDYNTLDLKDVLDKIDVLNLSCDNINNNSHERIGFNKEIFNSNLKYLQENDFSSNDLSIHSVWSKGRLQEVKEVREFCKGINCQSVVSVRIPKNKADIDKMPEIKDYDSYLKEYKNSRVKPGEESQDISIDNKTISCGAARNVFSVDANGKCYPCQSFHFQEFLLGDLLKDSFEDIYNSPLATILRVVNDVDNKETCKLCNLKYICSGGCIANTFEIEGNILSFPKTMCEYYKTGSINRLSNINY